MDTILPRVDVLGKVVVFFPETYNKEKNTITFWDGVHGHQKEETNPDYYFTSKPVSDEQITDISGKYTSNFGTKQLIVRKRLFKEQVMRTPNPEKPDDDKAAQREFLQKLLASLTKAINDAMPA